MTNLMSPIECASPNLTSLLKEHVAWGGQAWRNAIQLSIQEIERRRSLKGARVLDIGTRYGDMAFVFANLGAQVIGIDVSEAPLEEARKRAEKLDLTERITFQKYNGSLDIFADESFDVVFTKSVLVLIPELGTFLQNLSHKLKPSGQVAFIENARGNALMFLLRYIRHRTWNFRAANFFTKREAKLVSDTFDLHLCKQTFLPPLWIMAGSKVVSSPI